jgi:hypothetical protein
MAIDHVAEALARLPMQFRGKPRIEAFVRATTSSLQALEDASVQLLTAWVLDTAIGAQLDQLGVIVGQPRDGLSDADYRRILRARIAANRSDGIVEDLIQVARMVVYDDAAQIEVERQDHATILVRINGIALSAQTQATLFALLTLARAAGVRLVLESSLAAPGGTFTWDGTAGQAWDNGAFADADA